MRPTLRSPRFQPPQGGWGSAVPSQFPSPSLRLQRLLLLLPGCLSESTSGTNPRPANLALARRHLSALLANPQILSLRAKLMGRYGMRKPREG